MSHDLIIEMNVGYVGQAMSRRELDKLVDENKDPARIFKDVVASALNVVDDRVWRDDGVLNIGASDSSENKDAISFYTTTGGNDERLWVLSVAAQEGESRGFEIGEPPSSGEERGAAATRLFIQRKTGHVGLGSRDPKHRLHVEGTLKVTEAATFGSALSAKSITADGLITANEGLTVPAGKALEVEGALQTKAVTAGGLITANEGLTVPAGKTLTVEGVLHAKAITAGGLITASEGLTVPAGKTLTVDGVLKAKAISAGGLITASEGLTVPAGKALTVEGALKAKAITAGGLITASEGLTVTSSASTVVDIAGIRDQENKISLQLKSGNSAQNNKSNQIAFGYDNTATYRHAIQTRHNASAQAGNAIDFYVWKHGPDANAVGGSLALSVSNEGVTATNGVLVGCKEEKLRMIRGKVKADGQPETKVSGWSSKKVSTGRYEITCDPPFSGTPTVMMQIFSAPNSATWTLDGAIVDSVDNKTMKVRTGDSHANVCDTAFYFMIIGPA